MPFAHADIGGLVMIGKFLRKAERQELDFEIEPELVVLVFIVSFCHADRSGAEDNWCFGARQMGIRFHMLISQEQRRMGWFSE
jgi:hypothetical protein